MACARVLIVRRLDASERIASTEYAKGLAVQLAAAEALTVKVEVTMAEVSVLAPHHAPSSLKAHRRTSSMIPGSSSLLTGN
jgi:hypothetical protein